MPLRIVCMISPMMFLMSSLTACSLFGPRPALVQGYHAPEDGDLHSFEQVVDLDAVVPMAAQGCLRVTLLEGWSGPVATGPLARIAMVAGRGLLDGTIEVATPELLEQARRGFGDKPMGELCPAIQPGDLSSLSVDRDGSRAVAQIPIEAWGVQTAVSGGMRKVDGEWMLVSLDFDPAISEIKSELERQAGP